jgi:flagellar basal-body rod protein FlgF
MTRGIYTAATGMLADDTAQQVIAQNLANASTTGYKQDIPVFKTFAETLISLVSEDGVDPQALGSMGHGATLDRIYTDLSDGPLQRTGNNMDVALRGDAYLSVQSPAGTAYTRDGGMSLNAQGTLVQASSGLPVLSDQGQPIDLSDKGQITISSDGTVLQNNQSVAKLGLYSITNANDPSKIGDNLISVAQAPQAITANDAQGYVQSGYLEASNVNIVKEMVTMIACQRSYEANAKALQSEDAEQDKAVNTVGAVMQ